MLQDVLAGLAEIDMTHFTTLAECRYNRETQEVAIF